MQPPEEMLVQSFLPAIRQLVARKLSAEGLSQSRIGRILGVTQASVSLYLSSTPEKSYSQLLRFGLSDREADHLSAELAASISRNQVGGIALLNSIWTGLLGSGAACGVHRELYPSLADCEFCIGQYGQLKGGHAEAVSEVADAVKLLEGSPSFVAVMPEVSVNIACAAGDASTPADVIAVPGRIVKVRGRARAMLPPEAGASIHMSRILLLVRLVRPEVRACLNLRYDRRMAGVLKGFGLKSLTITGSMKNVDDPTAEALGRALQRPRAPFDAVVDFGGGGIEPNVYLLSTGAREVAELALDVARKYSAG